MAFITAAIDEGELNVSVDEVLGRGKGNVEFGYAQETEATMKALGSPTTFSICVPVMDITWPLDGRIEEGLMVIVG